ncbi:MAG TPA: hypothetical protein VEJ36_03475 [Nitrososphaerales archaeon]|nr:hypothetical protein [Nitrososphaerales archaeon]
MFFEKRLKTIRELLREVETLDADAGIRILGSFDGKNCFVFVSRTPRGYAAMVYARKKSSPGHPGRRVASVEFDGERETEGFIKQIAGEPVRAFVY